MNLIREIDRILRGEATRLEDLRDGRIPIPILGICFAVIVLGFIYGLCMSLFSLINKDDVEIAMILAPMAKVPLVFFLTVFVTFPSLYVFNALVGSRLGVLSVFSLIVTSLAVMLAVLASFGPIIAFFSFTTKSYSFMILLNVVIFAVSGILGLLFLLQTLHRLTIATGSQPLIPPPPPRPETGEASEGDAASTPSPLDRSPEHVMTPHVGTVFRLWIVVFGLVGAQMAWILRPFVGVPEDTFQWFRERQSNFFEAVWQHLVQLFT